MKHTLRRLTALALALCLLGGCAGEVPETDAQPTQTTQPENSPTESAERVKDFGLAYVPEYGFNPYDCVCLTNRPVISLAYEGLFVLNNQFEPEPVLCDTVSVSDDEKTYTVTLCQDARFSDGSAVTAQDVVASLQAATDSDYYGSRFYQIYELEAADTRTVILRLYTPYENLPLLLDVPIVKEGTTGDAVPVGSGPYTIRLEDGGGTLVRNNGWWQDAAPAVDKPTIGLTAAETPTQVRDSFEFGDTALVCADLNAPAAVGYRCDYELWNCSTTVMQYIGFNIGSGLFVNQSFRAAVTHMLDRDTIVARIYNGFADAACLPCSPRSNLYDSELASQYGYDEAAFRQAMKDAGIAKGSTGTILVNSADASRVEMAHFIADAMAEYGLKLEVRAVDADTYAYQLNRGGFDMFIGEVRLSGNFDLSEFFKPYGQVSYGGIQDAATYEMCKYMLENSGNAYDLHQSVMDKGYLCPVLFKSYAVMATRGVIGDLQPAVDNVFHLHSGRTLADVSVLPTEPETAQTEAATDQTTEEP